MQLQNPLYPLFEDELFPICALMCEAHGRIQNVNSTFEYKVDGGTNQIFNHENFGADVCRSARGRFSENSNYKTCSYPTVNLTKHAFDAWNKSVDTKNPVVLLSNFCCTIDKCPQIQFMKCVIDCLVELQNS